jgi:hypothetical protein
MNTQATSVAGWPSHRRTSLAAGVFYLLTFVSIPTLALYRPVKRADYILGRGPDTAAIAGGLLEIIVALAGIATAVVLFPVLKKQNERLALGLVVARILEASTIFLGVAFVLTIVTLRKGAAGTESLPIAHTLVGMYDRIFLLGQSFMPAIDDLLLGLLLYRSRLVPRALSRIGLVGAPLLVIGYIAILFGAISQHGPLAGLFALPVALFEFSLGIWLVVKGFDRQAVTALEGTRESIPQPTGQTSHSGAPPSGARRPRLTSRTTGSGPSGGATPTTCFGSGGSARDWPSA